MIRVPRARVIAPWYVRLYEWFCGENITVYCARCLTRCVQTRVDGEVCFWCSNIEQALLPAPVDDDIVVHRRAVVRCMRSRSDEARP